jgi:hypothetical protein
MNTAELALCCMICIPSFMRIGTGVQTILGFCLRNLRFCKVYITGGSEFINYSFQVGWGVMIYAPCFIKIGSGIQNLIWGRHRHTH